jgi:hypothetical protein
MRRLFVLLTLVLATAALAPAAAPARSLRIIVADLDGDGRTEQVRERVAGCVVGGRFRRPPCTRYGRRPFRLYQATLVQRCADGTTRRTDLLRRREDFLPALRLLRVAGASTPQILAEGRSGVSGRLGEVTVVAFARGADGCLRPRRTFDADLGRAVTAKPAGADYAVTPAVTFEERDAEPSGQVLRVAQPWYTKGDFGCCPRFLSTRFYRFDASTARWTGARDEIEELPENGR